MTTTEIFQVFTGLSGSLFVLTSMLAMAMCLTTTQFRRPIAEVAVQSTEHGPNADKAPPATSSLSNSAASGESE